MMVLGLVVQQQDTVAGVARRLSDQFVSARFSKTTAHKTLPRLAKKDYVRVIEDGQPEGSTRCRYEATPKGVQYFREWLLSTELPLAIRDSEWCKLEFVELDDLPALILIVREEEKAYTAACDIAREGVLSEQRSRRNRGEAVSWRVRLRGIQNKDDVNRYNLMSKRLEHLGNELERLLKDALLGRVG
jgi:DNA-binding PadR family transcriptional regulator